MKLLKVLGATSEIWQVKISDSSSTVGAGLTGLANNTSGLTAYYHRDTDTTATAITLASMTVGTFTSSGFKEIDATNMPGWYQFCPPNAAIASGAKSCGFQLKGATNMAQLDIEVQLTAVNPDSATAFITSVATVTTVTNQLTAAAIATGVWQDATAGDFTTSSSIGKSLYTTGAVPGAAGGLFIAGTNAPVTITGSGVALTLTSSGANGQGLSIAGNGSGAGMLVTGGATGPGLSLVGGGTSGDALLTAATSGHGATFAGTGTTKHGINATGGSTTSHGISATGGGVGHGILATSGGGSTGDGIKAVAASTNGNGMNLVGVGTGAGKLMTGGATGIGMSVVGGATSGDGIKVVTTSGHGINLAPVGTSMHGFFATGGNGGTSDGMSLVAGTGGVALRAAAITGTLSTVTTATTTTTATNLTNLPSIPANWLTAAGINAGALNGKGDWMVTYIQPTGFLTATFPSGTIANTTNITAGTITTVTTVTDLAGSAGIKKNQAKAAFMFLMTDSTNHNPATGLTVTPTRSLDGAAFGSCANSVTEVASGWYKIDLAAADLNADTVALKFTAAASDTLNISIVTGV